MQEVSREDFFQVMNRLNVHPRIVNNSYPYTSDWYLQDIGQACVGRTVGFLDNQEHKTRYYLLKND